MAFLFWCTARCRGPWTNRSRLCTRPCLQQVHEQGQLGSWSGAGGGRRERAVPGPSGPFMCALSCVRLLTGQGHPGASWPLCWASCRPRGQMHVCCIRDLCATYNIILNPSYSRIWSKLLEKMQEAGTSPTGNRHPGKMDLEPALPTLRARPAELSPTRRVLEQQKQGRE